MATIDIKITNLDIDLTQKSHTAPGLRHMYFELSETPPPGWEQFFEEERRFPRHSMWRRAWVEQNHIVIDCEPSEIERYHLNDLKTDVANANSKYTKAVAAAQAKREREEAVRKQKEAQEKSDLESLRNKLNFD